MSQQQQQQQEQQTGRKRTASEAEGSPETKKASVEDQLEILFGEYGEYPQNFKHPYEYPELRQPPPAHEEELTHQFDPTVFIDQNEAEDLLATLESLHGKLVAETQPLPLDFSMPAALQYNEPKALELSEWNEVAESKEEGKEAAQQKEEDPLLLEKSEERQQ